MNLTDQPYFGESPDGGQILTEEEYEVLLDAYEEAGINDPEVMSNAIKKVEQATIELMVLEMLKEGSAKVTGVNKQGDIEYELSDSAFEPEERKEEQTPWKLEPPNTDRFKWN